MLLHRPFLKTREHQAGPEHSGQLNVLLDLDLPNCFLTPHVAWGSIEALEGLADQPTGNVEAWASGTP
jgi:lactate dehydrogenase-like 2-hydroxyacid dehydrogenase